ncbi:MAG: hypothetical protein CVU48_06265 [Candidatus Cloacimonetes bacterium HGW-Cloacimonetes-1]|jgi:hydrogenase-4 component F|nr:MAG: hypothetical protein CVU48_06265 [Candidatus Cloacimonetes bacterium HGW-Cloacimonetes-1]
MILILLAIPVILAALSWGLQNRRVNNGIMLFHAVGHFALAALTLLNLRDIRTILGFDAIGVFFFAISALLYLSVVVYGLRYDLGDRGRKHSIYTICMLFFVTSMDGAVLSQDLGLIWVFIETTTLATAVLINHEQGRQSLAAAWKYLFVCSIGIAMAFVGLLILLIAQSNNGTLVIGELYRYSGTISPFWLKIAFVFLLVGFGTKIGLAPLHFWLPDAHSEAPAPVSALLSGALLNAALVPLLRVFGLMKLCGLQALAQNLFLLMGISSIFISAVFVIRMQNYKRLLAYSSIENMGIVLVAFGIGGLATTAGLIHILGHSLVKAAFFLTAGNIYGIYHHKDSTRITGMRDTNAPTAWLWLLCFVLLSGLPPSPIFLSEWFLGVEMLRSGAYWQFGIVFLLLTVVVAGIGKIVLGMSMGKSDLKAKVHWTQIFAPSMLLLVATIFGMLIPAYLGNLFTEIGLLF